MTDMTDTNSKNIINTSVLKQNIRKLYYHIRPLVVIVILAVIIIIINRYFLDARQINHQLIIDYLRVLQWPIVILLAYFFLQPYLPEMARRVKKIWGIEFEYEQPINLDLGDSLTGETKQSKTKVNDIETLTGRASAIENDPNIRWLLECSYRYIFGTQISALGYLKQIGGNTPIQDLESIYDRHVQLSGSPHLSINKWLSYLTGHSFANVENETVQITNAGMLFLDYLASQGITDPNNRPY